jgi:hypothetical protein
VVLQASLNLTVSFKNIAASLHLNFEKMGVETVFQPFFNIPYGQKKPVTASRHHHYSNEKEL